MSMPSIREQWNAPNFNRAAVALWGGFFLLVTHGLAVWLVLAEGRVGLIVAPLGWFMVAFIFSCESLGAAVTTTVKQWSRR